MAAEASREGSIVGRYRVGKRLGAAGSTTFYVGAATNGAQVVIAFLAPGTRVDPSAPRGANLARVLDSGDAGGAQFVVMESSGNDASRYAVEPEAGGALDVPDLVIPSAKSNSKRPSLNPDATSSGLRRSAPPPAIRGEKPKADAYGMVDFEGDPDDAPVQIETAVKSQRGALGRELAMGPGGAFVVNSRNASSQRRARDDEDEEDDPEVPSVGEIGNAIGRGMAVLVVACGCGFALTKFVRPKIDWNVLHAFPAMVNGSSVKLSAGIALGAVALCFIVGILALYARPRALGVLVSSFGLLVIGVAMIIVTLTTTPAGEVGPTPDGAFLVPWAMPLVPLGFALRFAASAWRRLEDGGRGIAIAFGLAVGAAVALFLTAHLLQVPGTFAMIGITPPWH